MARTTTYSFLDMTGSLSHPTIGDYVFTGEGVGQITVAYATERTAHDVAADGSVMVSKVAGNNGTITIECQQTSAVHKWLLAWYNALWELPTSEWATTAIMMRNSSTGGHEYATGVSPQKIGDKPYHAQGARVTWVLMAADIVSSPV
jgi:hypothetical protein